MKSETAQTEEQQKQQDDLSFNVHELKQGASKLWKKVTGSKTHSSEHHSSHDNAASFDLNSVAAFWKMHARWLIPLLCILLVIGVSVYLRTMPLRMPITEEWATNTVHNFYKNNIANQVAQQYPNLPEQNRNAYVEKEWQSFFAKNGERVDQDIATLKEQYKNLFRNDSGTVYLLGIDPYHYYRTVYNVLQYGHEGTTIKDGKPWDEYFLAPTGREADTDFHAYFGAFFHRVVNAITGWPLMTTFFFVGVFFSALSTIPAFFIGKRVTNSNVGGFFTGLLVATAAFFVSRTTGESSDTDVYTVFFPLLITWFFVEVIYSDTWKQKLMWIALAGIGTGIFSTAWIGGWWYIFDFIVATMGIYIVFLLVKGYKNIREVVRSTEWKQQVYLLLAYIGITGIVDSIFNGVSDFWYALIGPLGFLRLKAVGVTSLWPNIRTTVAELNVAPLSNVIDILGGRFLFLLALAGIVVLVFYKGNHGKRELKTPIFLAIWMIAALFATTKGIRFVLQITPVFSLALGIFLGIVWSYAWQWISKELRLSTAVTKVLVFVVLALFLIQPVKAGYQEAYRSMPSMNDAWYDTLHKIDVEGDKNAIINSWWDFGHWFKAIGNRPVTFDGASQVGWGAYWVGKSLLTADERQTAGILRMLNCGQNDAFIELDAVLNDTPLEIDILNKLVTQDRATAVKTLTQAGLSTEEVARVIHNTHCDAPTDYYITSDDMIGKSGVWGHFGAWNFHRAAMYQSTVKLSSADAVAYLMNNFNLTETQAAQTHAEIVSTPADQWISPWPGFNSGLSDCSGTADALQCRVGARQGNMLFYVDLETGNATIQTTDGRVVHPNSVVYATKQGVVEKEFSGEKVGFSLVIVPSGDETYQAVVVDPLHAASTFTKLFFFNGHGMKCFKPFNEISQFNGGKISTWVVDYDCTQENKVFFTNTQQVHAAHILVATIDTNRTDEEALQLIQKIKAEVTPATFGRYAQQYSDDPGSEESGGDLGWFKKGTMVPEFETAAFALASGQISEPIKTQFGYHLIYVLEKKD